MDLHILTITEYQNLMAGKTTVKQILEDDYNKAVNARKIDKSELSAVELDILESETEN